MRAQVNEAPGPAGKLNKGKVEAAKCILFRSSSRAKRTTIWNHEHNEESIQPVCLSRTGPSCGYLSRGSPDNLRKRLRCDFDERHRGRCGNHEIRSLPPCFRKTK